MRTPQEEKERMEASLNRGWALIDRLLEEGKDREANAALDKWIELSDRYRDFCRRYGLTDTDHGQAA